MDAVELDLREVSARRWAHEVREGLRHNLWRQAATRRRYICSEELIKVPPNTTYKINEVGSHLLHVLFYRAEGPGDNGAPEEEDGEDQ